MKSAGAGPSDPYPKRAIVRIRHIRFYHGPSLLIEGVGCASRMAQDKRDLETHDRVVHNSIDILLWHRHYDLNCDTCWITISTILFRSERYIEVSAGDPKFGSGSHYGGCEVHRVGRFSNFATGKIRTTVDWRSALGYSRP